MKNLLICLACFLSVLCFTGKMDAQNLRAEWIKNFGGSSFESGNFVISDNLGYVYLTGDYTDTADFGDTVMISTGSADAFIAKYDSLGNLIWINTINGPSEEYGVAIDFDQNNNIILGGIFHSDTVFIGDTSVYSCGCSKFTFVAKYTQSGDFLWANGIQGDGSVILRDIKVNSNNEIVFTGQFYHSIYLGSDTIVPNGLSDIFLAKYNNAGSGLLYWIYGGNNSDDVYSLELDFLDNMYISGHYTGKVTYGANTLNSLGLSDIFIAKTDPAGVAQWAITAGSPGEDRLYDMVMDDSRNMYITGYASDSAVFGTKVFNSNGYYDFIIAKYDSLGNSEWASIYGGIFDDQGNSLNLDEADNIYVTGSFISNMSVDTSNLMSNIYMDLFIAKFNSSGNPIWAKQFTGERNDEGRSIFVTGDDRFYITGNFRDSVFYDTTQIYSNGNNDILFVRFTKEMITLNPVLSDPDAYCFYPNPASDYIQINNDFKGEVKIFDMHGKLMLNAASRLIYLTHLPPGTYMLILTSKAKVVRKKLIIM